MQAERQPPGRPEWLVSVLEKAMQNVLWIMDELTSSQVLGVDASGREIVRLPAMPKTAVSGAQALAFARRKKVGAILGVTKERVVLISKKALPDGGVLWSAPVFLRSTSYSLGVTAGYYKQAVCLAIMNDKGLAAVQRPTRNLGASAAFLLDMNGSRVRPLLTSSAGASSQVQTDKEGGMAARYYLMEAGMVDLSCRGGSFGLDLATNQALYGPNFDAQEVLQCRVQPPPEFTPVYNRLNEFVREAKAINPRGYDRSATMSNNSSMHHGAGGSLSPNSISPQDSGLERGSLRRSSDSTAADHHHHHHHHHQQERQAG
ncbi:hypothetical protein C2E20_1298 [Micractinium conductrix]|uniref:Ysc84 actin-binding domain-containing protein n=1 Tax=Micractinium conductrix TaxID=554055 RepID=A0A2P6VN40_9CHLO|nr:hypothetical protein C2E20_1298 [Micractinium conductrix]|eukprot:PSC75521.1 hypothetical protein C2E20_1298 [Micractinium conductrix]